MAENRAVRQNSVIYQLWGERGGQGEVNIFFSLCGTTTTTTTTTSMIIIVVEK
jgi:hypothetical protein